MLGREDDKLLVGGRVDGQLDVVFPEDSFHAPGHVDGVARDASIEVVGEELVELQSEHTSLGEQGAVTLDGGEETAWHPFL